MLRCAYVLALALGLLLVGQGNAGAGQSHGGGGERDRSGHEGGNRGEHESYSVERYRLDRSTTAASSSQLVVGGAAIGGGDPELEALYRLELRYLEGRLESSAQPSHRQSDDNPKPFLMPIEDVFNIGGRGTVAGGGGSASPPANGPPKRTVIVIPPPKPNSDWDWSPGLEWNWRAYLWESPVYEGF